ncbi:MAG: hypothetical protein ABR501_05355 [Pyrinomonadaceae bacterium]
MSKQTLIATLLILLGHTFAFGFQTSEPWQKFSSEEGKFTILMPTKPKVEVKEVDSQIGKLTQYVYVSSTDNGLFQVSYADYTVDPPSEKRDSVLEAIREGVITGLKAELVTQKNITLQGYPGREFLAQRQIEGIDFVFHWRIFLVGRRVYQLAVANQKKTDASAEITKFVTSFELDQ